MTRARGFGLIELMIVLAITAILASVALPGYGAYLSRARRGGARVALFQLAQWLERAATASGRYPDRPDIPAGLLKVEGGHYRLSILQSGDSSFRIAAVPIGLQAGDRCGTLTLSHSGLREISNELPDVTADACWNR